MNSNFLNILAFCILMGNEKILTKSPDYILEKFERYIGDVSDAYGEEWRWGLDSNNMALLIEYHKTWNIDFPKAAANESE